MKKMKRYIQTMPSVQAVQWEEAIGHPLVKFGVSSTTDRFDDTPDGYYVIVHAPWVSSGTTKRNIKENDWMIFDELGNVVNIVDSRLFELQYSVEVPPQIKADMVFVSRLESDLGFMGSPSYEEAKKRIEQWKQQ